MASEMPRVLVFRGRSGDCSLFGCIDPGWAMVTFQQFTIPGKLANLNDYQTACRSSKHVGAKMKKSQEEIVKYAILAAHLKPMIEPIDIRFHWIEPNMKRDKDNIRFAAKFILDALKEMRIIKNDGWKNICTLSDKFTVNPKNPRIIVTLSTSYERGIYENDGATSNSKSTKKGR